MGRLSSPGFPKLCRRSGSPGWVPSTFERYVSPQVTFYAK